MRKIVSSSLQSSNSAEFATTSKSRLSPAAQWHSRRRKKMISKYGAQILPLERESHGLYVGLPLLILSNVCLAALALYSSKLSVLQVVAVAFFPGSMFSLWQLQICHDCLHGTLLPRFQMKEDDTNILNPSLSPNKMNMLQKYQSKIINWIVRNRNTLHSKILFWCSMPNAFGYYLYLQYGHLTHHKSLGDETKSNLETLFDSQDKYFEDGDALFVAHRMKLKGGIGPSFKVKFPKSIIPSIRKGKRGQDSINRNKIEKNITMSISNTGFSMWKDGYPLRNALAFTTSFLSERVLLIINDVVVALTGKNFFFLNKPQSFHDEVTRYCRASCLVKLALWYCSGSWKSVLFLYLAETLWSIPPHPACAMFITNHGSSESDSSSSGSGNNNINDDGVGCIPSSSTYAGKLYSLFTLGTNYHVEHHDFPTIPLHELGRLQKIAPEFYHYEAGEGSNSSNIERMRRENVFAIMKKTFAKPEFYACMDAGIRLD